MITQNSLTGKVALVTGSTTGLGLEIAKSLGQRGARVALNYAGNTERANRAFQEYTDLGYDGALFQADVCDQGAVQTLVGNIRKTLGPVDILVPNATGPQPQLPIEEYTWDGYQEMIDFFIKSPFLLTQAVIGDMKTNRWGRIVNIGSEVLETAVGNFSAYVAAKGGQKGWTHSMATELAPFGITVNLVSPGWIPTDRHANIAAAVLDAYKASIPVGRWGEPRDVANAVAFLCSAESSFVTGQTICTNGGRSPL